MSQSRSVSISQLFAECNIPDERTVQIASFMSGLEPSPKDDWLYMGIMALKDVNNGKGQDVRKMAMIGSGNGIDVIAASRIFPNVKTVYVTDIIADALPFIMENIAENVSRAIQGFLPDTPGKIKFYYLVGRDCQPLRENVDLVYGNLPLVAVDSQKLGQPLATTTLTDANAYRHLSIGDDDRLRKYSLLSQLGFLNSAKEKLEKNGSVVTLIGGRIPYDVIQECFDRAEMNYRQILCGFKKQSDPQFLEHYAELEAKENVEFLFYDYSQADELLRLSGFDVPGVIPSGRYDDVKDSVRPAKINAREAYRLHRQGKDVGHLAFAFEVSV